MNDQPQYLGDGVTVQLVNGQITLTAGSSTIRLKPQACEALVRFARKLARVEHTTTVTYEQALDLIEDWKALGKGFNAFDHQIWGETRRVVFRHLNDRGRSTDINVWNDQDGLRVTFPSGRERNFPLNALPAKPFRRREVQQVWDRFLAMLSVPQMENMHERFDLNS
jgi:hypothetical protein